MDLMRVVRGPRALPRWAIASLVANIGIVVTGGLVRLTGSGLGCPTWPRCTDDSFVAHPALGAARSDRVRQPAAHLRADHHRRAHLRQRAALP